MAAPQPSMARATEAGSVRSPGTHSSGATPSSTSRGVPSRTRARTAWPRATSARATAEPRKPVAPVSITVVGAVGGAVMGLRRVRQGRSRPGGIARAG